jgi:hypothetical protein
MLNPALARIMSSRRPTPVAIRHTQRRAPVAAMCSQCPVLIRIIPTPQPALIAAMPAVRSSVEVIPWRLYAVEACFEIFAGR